MNKERRKPHKRKEIYREGYKSPGHTIRPDFLPHLPHLADESTVLEAYITAAGRYDDGCEFQYLRVVIRPPA